MNHQLKKRVRKLIREHFEEKFKMTYEQKKDMYRFFSIIDEVIEKVEVLDLVAQSDIDRARIVDSLVDGFKDLSKKVGMMEFFPLNQNSEKYTIKISYEKAEK